MMETTGMDDNDHLAVIGALGNPRVARADFGLRQAPLRVMPWMANASPQGVSTPQEELDFLPLDGVDQTNSGGVAIDIEDELSALPQRPFRGERVILQCVLIQAGGAALDALFRLIITPALYVGAVQVGATQGRMPAIAFGPQAFGVRLSMPVAGQGTRVYMPFVFQALGAGERLIVGGGIFGRAVR